MRSAGQTVLYGALMTLRPSKLHTISSRFRLAPLVLAALVGAIVIARRD